MILGTAFGLSIAFLGTPYYYPFYAEMVGQSLITGDVPPNELGFIMNSTWAIEMLLCYLIPSIIVAYIFFKNRDVYFFFFLIKFLYLNIKKCHYLLGFIKNGFYFIQFFFYFNIFL